MKTIERLKYLLPCLLVLFISGCYEEKVKEAVSELKIGMTKTELDQVFKDVKFLKEQTVAMYPNSTEEEMRASLIGNKHYEFRHPENVIDLVTFDGNTKVYSYLIRKEKIYANPTAVDYIAVFYNQNEDKVIGWAQLSTSGDVDTWRDKF